MALPDKLVSQFAKMLKPDNSKKETTVYGTIVEENGSKYVRLDGSEFLTPISTTVDMLAGERVTVLIKNHSAIVTGNITSPAARTGTVIELEEKISTLQLINMIYPVGSIYLSVSSTSPETLFAGTKWEQIQDRFLLASGTTYGLGATGGEATHTLTVNEMPAHNHGFATGISETTAPSTYGYYPLRTADGTDQSLSTVNTGGSQAHNNMPPYLAVNVWKRIE